MFQLNAYLPLFTQRMRKALLILIGLLMLYSVLGFFALPALLRPWLEKEGSAVLHRQVSIGKIEINPFLFRATLRDVAIRENDSVLFSFVALAVDGELASIWRRGPVLREITLDTPRAHIVRLTADQYNFSDLLAHASPAATESESTLPRFSLNNIRILNGQIELDDRFLHTQHTLNNLQLALPFVSTLPHRLDDYIEPGLSGQINGAPFKLTGQSKPFQVNRETRLALQLDGLDIPHYLAYVPLPSKVSLPSGKLSGQVDIVFREENDQPQLLIEGHLGLVDGRLDYQGEPILNLPAVDVVLKKLAPLLGEYRFARISFDKPALSVTRNAAGEFNWLTAFASGKPTKLQASAPVAKQALLEVDAFALNAGRIDWKDTAVKPGQSASIEGLAIQAQHLSSAAHASAPVTMAFKTGRGEDFRSDLNVQVQPLMVDGHLALNGVQPANYTAYLKPYFLGEFSSGQLDTALNVHFAAQPQVLEISQGEFGVKDLAIRVANEKKPALKLSALAARGITLNLAQRQVALSSLSLVGAETVATLAKNGRINLQDLLPPPDAAPAPVKQGETAQWRIKLASLDVEKSAVRLEDQREKNVPPLILTGLGLSVQGLDSAPGSQARMNFSSRAGRRGAIKISGPFVPQPFSAKWQVDVRQFDAAFAQPYFADVLNIQLASIWLAARGQAQIATAPKMQLRYRGSLALSDLHAIDKQNGADFLKWRSLSLDGIDLQSDPFKLVLKEVALSDFYSRLILSREGRLNLQDIVVREGQTTTSITSSAPLAKEAQPPLAPAPAPKAVREPLPPINIGKITLAGGNINYTDNFIQPNFTANLMDMGGEISGLSSNEAARATLDLRGSVDRIAPVMVAGSLNPLAQQIFLDIKAAVKGYELTAASTYSAKYAGYGIEKGKLSMDVAYAIENSQLKASNRLLLDQLTLGEKVDSPDATNLPVKFALALLTDRKGQINLNLPIEGSLNDPQFRIGGIIWQVIGNVLTKVVTSPFSALGSLLGGDEATFSRVEFAPGHAALGKETQDALGKLAKALDERPALQLEITGWVEPEADREGLKRNKLAEKILARKLALSADKGQSLDEASLAMTDEERLKLLGQVYDREKFPKPRNAIGMQKTLPAAEMEKLILANTQISEDDLRNLGLRRASVVKDALQAAGVDQSRLFILKPRLDPPADVLKKDGGQATRVQFILK